MLQKTLESPFDCKEVKPVNPKGNQLWIYSGRTVVETEAPIFVHLIQRADSLEKTLMLGKIDSKRRRSQQMKRQLDSITNSMVMNFSKLWEIVTDRWAWCDIVHRVAKNLTQLSDWTTMLLFTWLLLILLILSLSQNLC